MKVDIKHSESTTGIFSKTTHNVVTIHVQFNEEETHIIESADLTKDVVLERSPRSDVKAGSFDGIEDVCNLTIYQLVKGPNDWAFSTPIEAKEYAAALEDIMPKLKEHIMENAEVEQKDTSFEL